jgi:lipid A ethanolaminephosphotransferase
MFGALVALLSLLAWRWTLKPVLVLLLLAAAFGAYFMGAYRMVIDPTMLVNVLQTNPGEAADLFSLRMLGHVVLLLAWCPPGWCGARRCTAGSLAAPAWAATCWLRWRHWRCWPAAVVASFQPLSSTMRNHKQVRYLINPLNSVYALGMVAAQPLRRNESACCPLATDARCPSHAPAPSRRCWCWCWARRHARPTSPQWLCPRHHAELAAKLPWISWRNAWSAAPTPPRRCRACSRTWGAKIRGSRKANHENLLDVIQRAGLACCGWTTSRAARAPATACRTWRPRPT